MVDAGFVDGHMNGTFPTTNWGLVLAAASDQGAPQLSALESLFLSYWPALYAFLRRSGLSSSDAEDMVQAFADHLLSGSALTTVCPEKGRFRTFLLVSLRNFQTSQLRQIAAEKRGGRAQFFSLDLVEAERLAAADLTESVGLTPDKAYDRQWARTVMARSLERLEAEYCLPKQRKLFQALKPMLSDSGRVNGEGALASELEMSPGALAVAATRLRQRFRALIEDEVAQTLGPGGDLATELQALREAWL